MLEVIYIAFLIAVFIIVAFGIPVIVITLLAELLGL
jgi:hypothetical protein